MLAELALPVLYTLFLWWFSTGVIIYLDGLPRPTHRWTLAGATVLLAGSLWALVHTSRDVSIAGAYCSFTCALLVWAWQEVAFLMGIVTGPRRTPLPPGARGWRRTRCAIEAVLYHEIALLLLAVAVALCVGSGSNRVGLWTYLTLWVMRQSTKLNIFLGVRNLYESFLPAHLLYLSTYFRRRPMNVLFPLSVTLATGVAMGVWWHLVQANEQLSDHQTAGLALTGTLLALGALEHWLLVLPLPAEALWRWGLSSHAPQDAERDPTAAVAHTLAPPA